MNNYYKRMYVLSEEEYNRLKLIQKVPSIAVPVEEPPTTDSIQDAKTTDSVVTPPLQSTTTTVRYTCIICAKSYKQKRDLRRHVQIVHKPPTKTHVLQKSPQIESNIVQENRVVATQKKVGKIEKSSKKQKKKQHKIVKVKAFEKVKKWMTMRD